MKARDQAVAENTYPQLTSGLTLAAMPTAVRFARLFVRRRLSQWGLNRLINDAESVTSELATNAVNATGVTNPTPRWSELHNLALISVRLVVTANSVVIEVWDRDPRWPVQKEAAETDEAGRGLLIVGTLCRRWNYFFPEAGGKAVWCELAIPAHELTLAGLPMRYDPRIVLSRQTREVPSVETLEYVLEGLRKL
jgi:anti-sigma regulatory factor (Ser/Thr protein kinase)